MSELLTLKEAEQFPPYYKADWYRRKLTAGKIRGSKVGGQWFIEKAEIEALFKAGSNLPPRSDAAKQARGRGRAA